MTWQLWLQAFVLTQAIEIPVWLAAARRLPMPHRWLVALGASAITHPVLWFVFPWDSWPYVPTVLLGEAFVVLAEALFAGWLGVPRPWLWSLAANATSAGIGLLLQLGSAG